jgi:hypothetical protein
LPIDPTKLVHQFERIDYTERVIKKPLIFNTEYMIRQGTVKARLARFIVQYIYGLCPSYIWLLRKPDGSKKSMAL